MPVPQIYPVPMPPIVGAKDGTIINNRLVIWRAIRVVADTIRVAAVTVRVVGRISVNARKSEADAN